ncbi:MAG TPA: GTPase Era [Alphaproteobacteria bacterium]|nr:GTPase Era [Alphaproteobacteria bacterium]HAM47765.1 GTPase Era [Alphaproteobacteria bacterium]HBA43469.1 GTPase Era [Alphaproteobacteria bacterium]HBC53029.1 GTPase Era [Alphaproteobacteria bacterium]HCO90958.1 GTPase Era [Alphaproteobacteria bacterium]
MDDAQQNAPLHCGFVALIGPTNAGKSTLLNQAVGAKLSIVTHKVQTTRFRVRGIAIRDAAQIIFVDTPGIFKPRRRLDRAMVDAAWGGAREADLIILVIDAERGLTEDAEAIARGLVDAGRRAILALNKVDLVKRESLLALTDAFRAFDIFDAVFMISAESGDGVAQLLDDVARRLPPGPWLYPEDQLSDITERLMAAEITREKLYLRLHQELPYDSTVETEAWERQKDGSVRVSQVIYVRRDSQKPIVLGKRGQTIKQIGAAARAEMAETFGCPIHLFLFVKVSGKWVDDPERYREIGLDFSAG